MNYKYHYVYRITNTITEMHYYGDRSCNCHPSEDIGIKYFSSFTNKFFKQDQKDNPQDYKYKIVKIFETCRIDAKQLEVDLHKRFDVKNHKSFINRANQTSSGFDTSGTKMTFSETHRLNLSIAGTGRKNTEESKVKMREVKLGVYKGEDNPFYGKTHSDEQKKKWSKERSGTRLSVEHKRKINKNSIRGSKSHLAKIINIFDSDNNIMFICNGDFKKVCNDNNLPYDALREKYGSPIFQSVQAQTRAKKNNREEFIGWYAKKVD